MKSTSHHILRVGIAITFLWIGVLILKEPEMWVGYIQPWAMKLLPVSAIQMMIGTAFLDVAIGVFLLIDWFVWLAALAGAIHLIIVLAVSGITDITVRDIAILAGTLALMVDSLPQNFIGKIQVGDQNDQGRSQ